jgi:hypothetical protein
MVSLNMAVFWYEFINVSDVCTVSIIMEISLMMEISETLVNSYQSTRRYSPEDSHLQE